MHLQSNFIVEMPLHSNSFWRKLKQTVNEEDQIPSPLTLNVINLTPFMLQNYGI